MPSNTLWQQSEVLRGKDMPAVSKKQRRFFGMLEHNPAMAREKGVDMTRQQMHDFAATKEKGLPEQTPSRKRKYYGSSK